MENHDPPMYYSSLLSEGFSLDDPNLLDEFSIQTDVPIQTPENESNKRSGRKGNYTIEEDALLVSGWLNVSMDPIQGNDQKHGRYWERVHEYFHEYKNFESERNSTALAKRWSTIQLAVNKFCGYYASIERMQQSGVGEQDKICQALEMFKSMQNQPFGFMHCWRILKDAPKWRTDNSGKKQKSNRKSSPAASSPSTAEEVSLGEDDSIEDTISARLERPMGRKASKALFKKGKGIGDTSTPMELRFEKFEHQMKLNQQKRQENMDRIYFQEQEKLNILKAQEDERIMMIDTANMEPEVAEYYKQRKKEIMKRVTSSS